MVEDNSKNNPNSVNMNESGDGLASISKDKDLEARQVLVIDDEEMLVQLMQRFLEISGIRSSGYTNPHAALDWYDKNHAEVGLVILDLKMSGMDGKEVFKKMQNINPSVKVGFLSGFVEKDVKQDLIEQGALGFFQKPLRYPELVNWIKSSLTT